jgi:predicted nucleic acid-binding protein
MRRFFDTNVLVYSQDPSDTAKQALAQSLVAAAIDDEEFVVSTQVLAEFYATVLRRKLLAPAPALALVKLWSENDVVSQTPELLLHGLELQPAHSVSVWDALVVQAAIEARCDVLLSEDLQHGRRFGELEIVNPFLASSAHEGTASYRARRSSARSKRVGRAVPYRTQR